MMIYELLQRLNKMLWLIPTIKSSFKTSAKNCVLQKNMFFLIKNKRFIFTFDVYFNFYIIT